MPPVDCSAVAGNPMESVVSELLNSFICTYSVGAGFLVVGLVVWFTVSSMTYIRTGSIIMPIIFTFLLGGAALAQLPAIGLGVVSIIVVGGAAAITVLFARRLDRV